MLAERAPSVKVLCWALVLAAGLEGCGAHSSAEGRPGEGSARIFRQRRVLMGTEVTVNVVLRQPDRAAAAMAVAFAPIERVERRMSEYRLNSELMQINRTAHKGPVRVSGELWEVLRLSQEVAGITGGAFDITCGPIIDLWREAARRQRPPTSAERAACLERVGFRKLLLDPKEHTVRFKVAGMKVVLGAVAKGYAVDLAIRALRAEGFNDALVEAGGDLYASGSAPGGRPWRVGVQDPRQPDRPLFITTLALRDRAAVTSGNYHRFFVIQGRRYSHIVDPRTALTADALPSVTVIAPSTARADALATAVSVLGLEEGMRLVENLPDTECLIVTVEGNELRLHRSSGFARYEVEGEGRSRD